MFVFSTELVWEVLYGHVQSVDNSRVEGWIVWIACCLRLYPIETLQVCKDKERCVIASEHSLVLLTDHETFMIGLVMIGRHGWW